jgi:hypothetical protein
VNKDHLLLEEAAHPTCLQEIPQLVEGLLKQVGDIESRVSCQQFLQHLANRGLKQLPLVHDRQPNLPALLSPSEKVTSWQQRGRLGNRRNSQPDKIVPVSLPLTSTADVLLANIELAPLSRGQ